MLNTKALAGFLGRFLVFFTVLLLLWSVVGDAYGVMYRQGMTSIYSGFFPGGEVKLDRLEDDGSGYDSDVVLTNVKKGLSFGRRVNSRQQGYIPTVYVVSLILATPIPWSRRLKLAMWGLLIVSLYVPLRLLPALIMSFAHPDFGIFALGPTSEAIVRFLTNTVHINFAGHFVLPIPIWFLLCFRRADIVAFMRRAGSGSRETSETRGKQPIAKPD